MTQNTSFPFMRFLLLPLAATALALYFWYHYFCSAESWWILLLIGIFIAHYGIFLIKHFKKDTSVITETPPAS